jgi:hypothetical protein
MSSTDAKGSEGGKKPKRFSERLSQLGPRLKKSDVGEGFSGLKEELFTKRDGRSLGQRAQKAVKWGSDTDDSMVLDL